MCFTAMTGASPALFWKFSLGTMGGLPWLLKGPKNQAPRSGLFYCRFKPFKLPMVAMPTFEP